MLTTFKADVKKLPGGLQVEANTRGFKILLDEPADLGGTDKGMNPVEAVSVSYTHLDVYKRQVGY